MTILEMLKGAKTFLSQTGKDNLPNHICFAVEAYVRSVNMHQSRHWCYLATIPEKDYIHNKLSDLARKSYSYPDYSFTDKCASYILNIEAYEVTSALRQQARHIWLDSLIAELETAQSKTY